MRQTQRNVGTILLLSIFIVVPKGFLKCFKCLNFHIIYWFQKCTMKTIMIVQTIVKSSLAVTIWPAWLLPINKRHRDKKITGTATITKRIILTDNVSKSHICLFHVFTGYQGLLTDKARCIRGPFNMVHCPHKTENL